MLWLTWMECRKINRLVSWAVGMARKKRTSNRKRHEGLRHELSKRAAHKKQKKVEKERKQVEAKLRTLDPCDLEVEFPDLENNSLTDLVDIMTGAIVGRNICHVWYDANCKEKIIYNGRVEKPKRRKGDIYMYKISYWRQDETYEDAVDCDISKFELGADLINDDFVLS